MNSFNNEVPRGLKIPFNEEDRKHLDTLELPILTERVIEDARNNVSSMHRPSPKLELVTTTEELVLDVVDEYQTEGLNNAFIKKTLTEKAETLRTSKTPDVEIQDALRETLNGWRIPTKKQNHKAA